MPPLAWSLLILVIFCLPGRAPAQAQSAGPLVGSAMSLAVEGGANGQSDAATRVHPNGFGSATPLMSFPASPSAPDLEAILAFHGLSGSDVDDISTGTDDIMVDSQGITVPPQLGNGWGMFSFSFAPGAVGAAGSRVAAEPASDVAAAIFTWILPGSQLPAPLLDVVERSHSRDDLGVVSGGNVDSLDIPLVLGLDQGTLAATEPGFAALRPSDASIYFTFDGSSANLASVPVMWWNNVLGLPTTPSGATIFVTTKFSTAINWTVPTIYKTYDQLGFAAGEDIDGLALDASTDRLIVSCVGTARDQFLFVDASTDGTPVPTPISKPNGVRVSSAVGSAGGDDIDAICTLDPVIRNGLYTPDDFGASCGTPRPALQPQLYPVGVSASAFRRFENGQSHYDTWMVGWPPVTGNGPGWAMMFITIADLTSPGYTVVLRQRNPASGNGDPQGYTLSIPSSFVLSGMPLTFRWFAADAVGSEISQAWPIKVFL